MSDMPENGPSETLLVNRRFGPSTNMRKEPLREASSDSESPLLKMRTSSGLLLSRLQFPHQVVLTSISGAVSFAEEGRYARRLAPHVPIEIAQHRWFDLLILPSSDAAAECRIELRGGRGDQFDATSSLSTRVAELVFDAPYVMWSLRALSQRLRVSEYDLKMGVFSENGSVRLIVRTQRVMSALSLLLSTSLSLEQVATRVGWSSIALLTAAFREILMVDPITIPRTGLLSGRCVRNADISLASSGAVRRLAVPGCIGLIDTYR